MAKGEELRQMAAELKSLKVSAFNAQKEDKKIRQNAELQAQNARREAEQLNRRCSLSTLVSSYNSLQAKAQHRAKICHSSGPNLFSQRSTEFLLNAI